MTRLARYRGYLLRTVARRYIPVYIRGAGFVGRTLVGLGTLR